MKLAYYLAIFSHVLNPNLDCITYIIKIRAP